MDPQKAQKIEKTSGYIMLILGLFFAIIPAILAIVAFLGAVQVPQLIQYANEQDGLARSVSVLANACLIFFFFIIPVWAGSIISSRGVAMIKDVKLKLVGKSLKEAKDAAKKAQKLD
jgi:hypothetical protein